ncbi:MAG: hypothetical protein RLZZ301_1874 [Bacteroidota bacterium]|jgi:hypothetical protein
MQYILRSLLFVLFAGPMQAQVLSQTQLEKNNVRADILNNGAFFYNASGQHGGYQVPKSGEVSTIFYGGFWIGAQDPYSNLHVSICKETASSFSHGPIASGASYNSLAYDALYHESIWKVSKAEITQHQLHWQDASYVMPISIEEWPGNGEVSLGVAAQLAPYIDLNANGIYEPQLGDYPDIRGDEACYVIYNDATHLLDENKLGIEVHAMFYQFTTGNYLNNTTFLNLRVFNRSSVNYHNYRQALFLDFDIGFYADDYIGCAPEQRLLYGYNADDYDEVDAGWYGYGANPPSQGVMCMSHPLENASYFPNWNFTNADTATWLLMNSQWADSSNWIDPLSNQATNFVYNGNPNDSTQWSAETSQQAAHDGRGFLTIHENNFAKNTSICTDYAFIYNKSGTRLHNVQELINTASSLQELYNYSSIFPCTSENLGLIAPAELSLDVNVFPNPARNTVNVKVEIEAAFEHLSLVDLQGNVLHSQSTAGLTNLQLELSELMAGSYFVVLEGKNGTATKLLVIE